MTKLHELAQLGQAIWFDYIQRSILSTGELKNLVDQGVRGVTSNPSIFEKAIAGSFDYDEDMVSLVDHGKSVVEIYETLAMEDIRHAADILRPLYVETRGLDGYVSLEVSPTLAHDTEGTISDARRLFAALDRPNVFIKVPATPAGIPAISTLIGEGININVTLIFSLAQYEVVMQAYLAGLEILAARGADVGHVASVASLFVSRVDVAVDPKLEPLGAKELLGTIAISNAKVCYERFREVFSGERWRKLTALGARVQRPLWASTGTKNPAYPDTLYVDSLIGSDTVNTAPPETIQAFLDHGQVAITIDTELEKAHQNLDQLKALGIDLDAVCDNLLTEGVVKFTKSFESLLRSIADKREQLLSSIGD
jgi:transaldolase